MSLDLDRVAAAVGTRYTVQRALASGGMAHVFLAVDVKHDRAVAIKVLKEELADSLGPERFLREIRIAARLQHPHILTLIDSGETDGLLFYVMPFVEGESLRERMNREGQLRLADAVRITSEVARALRYAHDNDVVHRDIKPENILLSGNVAVVADFGIARALDAAGSDRLTASGMVAGTPAYMSPEQADGEGRLDARSDQYSLACVAYEMLIGEPPFTGPNVMSVLARHSVDRAPSLRTVRTTIPPRVEEAVHRALAKLPADRFETVDAFATALALGASSDEAPLRSDADLPLERPSARTSSARRFMYVGAVLAVVAAGLLSVLFWPDARPPTGPPRLVVLPFENLGPSEDAYFADGITDEITSRIAGLSGLETISRATAVQLDRGNRAARAIGRELGVDYVLSGAIRTDRSPGGGGSMQVIPHLVRVQDDVELYSGRLTMPIEPGRLFEAQSAIAESVAVALNVSLLLPERLAFQSRPTESLAAYEHYLRGNVYSAHRLLEEPSRRSIESYTRATELDTSFALAFAKLAQAQSIHYFNHDRTLTRRAQAESALARAQALDSLAIETRLASGYVQHYVVFDFDWALEELSSLRRQLSNNPELFWLLGSLESRRGEWDAGLRDLMRAATLDPRSPSYAYSVAGTLLTLRRFAESATYFDRVIALSPDWIPAYLSLGFLHLVWTGDTARMRQAVERSLQYADTTTLLVALIPRFRSFIAMLGQGYDDALARLPLASVSAGAGYYYLAKAELFERREDPRAARAYYDSAIVALQQRLGRPPERASLHTELALAFSAIGRPDDARQEIALALELVHPDRDAIFYPSIAAASARVLMNLGDLDSAITVLTSLIETPSFVTPAYLRVHVEFVPLRAHPGFQALLERR
ncbi:MAG TPA: protein kinase [Gemmatimonadales bacterium]